MLHSGMVTKVVHDQCNEQMNNTAGCKVDTQWGDALNN